LLSFSRPSIPAIGFRHRTLPFRKYASLISAKFNVRNLFQIPDEIIYPRFPARHFALIHISSKTFELIQNIRLEKRPDFFVRFIATVIHFPKAIDIQNRPPSEAPGVPFELWKNVLPFVTDIDSPRFGF
jgi:hypothetical protein